MLASPKDPSVFRCRSPVGPKRKSHLSAKGTRKLGLSGRFLMFRDQILKHLAEYVILLRFRAGSQKVLWGSWTPEGPSSLAYKNQKSEKVVL